MSFPPRVYVIVLNWNTWEVTCDCLRSLAKVDYQNFQTVIVDNGSSNDSADQLATRFPDVPLIRNRTNRGYAGGNNVGIRYALQHNADYVLLLNNDTEVSPSFLQEMVRIASADPAIGLVNPKIFYFDPADRIWYAGGTFSLWRGVANHIGLGRHDNPRYNQAQDCTFGTGCALMASAEMIRKVGDLDENFFLVCEDTDWSIGALRAGFRVVYAPSAVIWHKESYTIRETAGKQLRDYYNIRNTLLLARKHARYYHWPSVSVFLASTLAYRTLGYCVRGEFDRVAALYRGLRDGLNPSPVSQLPRSQAQPDS